MTLKTTLTAALLGCLYFSPVRAQEQKGKLLKGKTVSARIATGQKHQYRVSLAKDQFAFLQVMQKGADVKVTTYDLRHRKVAETDSPNGGDGPENITLSSTAKGDYAIDIEALSGGIYEATLQVIRPKARTAGQRIDELFVPWDHPASAAATVAVYQKGKLVYQHGYGMANIEQHVPNRPGTSMHIASITKTFTAYSLLRLQQEGKLRLDDDIRKYLPEVPDFGHTITLRHLAQHTSGIRTYESLAAMSGYEIHSKAPFFKLISRQRDLNFLPGEGYDYSNTGFVLLAEVIERVSGMSYANFIQKHIFQPLHMKHTTLQVDAGKLVAGVADSYEPGSGGVKKQYVINDLVGSTGIITDVADLGQWGLYLLHPAAADTAIIRQMRTPGKLHNGQLTEYGLGLALATYKGHREIGHSGSEGGFKAHLSIFPDDDLVVIVLANSADIYSRPVARQIADNYLTPKKETIAPLAPESPATPKKPAETNLDIYTGTYYSAELETAYHLTLEKGKLNARHSYLKDIGLSPDSRDTFSMDGWNGTAEFERDAGGKITGCRFSYNRMKNLYFKKL